MRFPFRESDPIQVICDFNCHKHSEYAAARQYPGTDYATIPARSFPILATEDQRLVRGFDPNGAIIIVGYAANREWQYVHLQTIVRLGYVKEGDIIGYAGMTGLAENIHLHLGLLANGKRVDPDLFIRNFNSYDNNDMTEEQDQRLRNIERWTNDFVPNIGYLLQQIIAGPKDTHVDFKGGIIHTWVENDVNSPKIHSCYEKDGVISKDFINGSTFGGISSEISIASPTLIETLTQTCVGVPEKVNDKITQRIYTRSTKDGITWTAWVPIS